MVVIVACVVPCGGVEAQEQEPLRPPEYEEPEDNAFDDYLLATELLPQEVCDEADEVHSADRYTPQDVGHILASPRRRWTRYERGCRRPA